MGWNAIQTTSHTHRHRHRNQDRVGGRDRGTVVSDAPARLETVRVVLAASPGFGAAADDGRPPAALTALHRLGPEAHLDVVRSPSEWVRAARQADLVVLGIEGDEPALGVPAVDDLLLRLNERDEGPPLLVVLPEGRASEATEWFRRGAAECVIANAELEMLLPSVALEQIRRWRKLRAKRRSERRLRFLENLNDAIVSEIPAALAVLDAERRIVTVNPAFTRAWEVESRDAVGRPLADVLPADLMTSGRIDVLLTSAAAGHPVAPCIARAGALGGGGPGGGGPGGGGENMRAFDVRAQRLDDSGRLLLVLADVSERERMSRRIAELQRYNENIIQNMNSALLVVDAEGKITFANRMAEQILETSTGGLAGRTVWDWFSSGQAERSYLSRTLAEGVRFRGAETFVTRHDGRVVPVGISCAPLDDADGTRIGAVAIFQDLSEIQQLQRQVLQSEKMASIGQLAAGVAHEINNPMGFIHANLYQMEEYLGDVSRIWDAAQELAKAATEVAAEGATEGRADGVGRAAENFEAVTRELDPEFLFSDFRKAVQESQEGSERIRHIVQDLRNFSHRDTDERVPADLNQSLDSTANIVWSMMKHTVRLKKDYGELPEVRCYPMQLQQVFMNLLMNAYHAILERVGESGEVGEIELRTEDRGDRVAILVSDTGPGIPPEDLGRIFDPFFTTKEVGVGTGLGLATSFNIIEKHGGSIRARNRSGAGATFEVVLPVDPVGGGGEGA